MSTTIIETLKSQFDSIELQIKELLNSKESVSPLYITIIDDDLSFDLEDILDSLQKNQAMSQFPKIQEQIVKLQQLAHEENKTYLNACEKIKQLKSAQEELTSQLKSFFTETYDLQINKAYDKSGNLKNAVQLLLKLYPELKSYKKYGDKFIIVFTQPITKDSLIEQIKSNIDKLDNKFKGTIDINKTVIGFHNYHHYI